MFEVPVSRLNTHLCCWVLVYMYCIYSCVMCKYRFVAHRNFFEVAAEFSQCSHDSVTNSHDPLAVSPPTALDQPSFRCMVSLKFVERGGRARDGGREEITTRGEWRVDRKDGLIVLLALKQKVPL